MIIWFFSFILFFIFVVSVQHAESYFPDQGSDLFSLQWKCRVLTTGLQGIPSLILLMWRVTLDSF